LPSLQGDLLLLLLLAYDVLLMHIYATLFNNSVSALLAAVQFHHQTRSLAHGQNYSFISNSQHDVGTKGMESVSQKFE
jgi:hypothetical protein